MQGLAEKLDEGAVTQELGTVVAAGDELAIQTRGGRYDARRAVSCLVAPAVDDTVLVAIAPTGRAWVLAVLDREQGAPTEIAAEGDLHVKLSDGRFRVSAEGVDIISQQDTRMASRRLDIHSHEAATMFDKLTYLGKRVHLDVDQVKSFVTLFDTVAERISQRVKRSYRFVTESDITRAKQIDMRAEDNVHVRGRNTMVAAEILVKVDGEQIHLG